MMVHSAKHLGQRSPNQVPYLAARKADLSSDDHGRGDYKILYVCQFCSVSFSACRAPNVHFMMGNESKARHSLSTV